MPKTVPYKLESIEEYNLYGWNMYGMKPTIMQKKVWEDVMDLYEKEFLGMNAERPERGSPNADGIFADRLAALQDSFENGHPDSQQFYNRLLDLAELHDRKQHDYGRDSDPFANVRRAAQLGLRPSLGVILRMGDKFGRLESFAQKENLLNEPVDDSLQDLAVYALIALVLMSNGE